MWPLKKKELELPQENDLPYSEASRQTFLRDTQEIIDRLASRVQKDRNAFDDYLMLGRLYRIRSQTQRSLRLHRNLLLKSDITRDQKTRLLTELGFDLLELRAQDFGTSYFTAALEIQKNYVPGLEGLARAYELQGHFENAATILERLIQLGRPENGHLAFVLAASAKKHVARGLLAKARRITHNALKADETCLYAHLTLAEVYLEGAKYEKALKELKKILIRWPSHSFLVLRRMEDCHYRMNQFPAFEETLFECLRSAPDNFYLHYSLARHLRKKKRNSDALTALKRALEVNPYYVNSVKDRIEMTSDSGELSEVRRIAKDFFSNFKESRHFICPNCRHRHSTITWSCDACGLWNTFEVRYELPAP